MGAFCQSASGAPLTRAGFWGLLDPLLAPRSEMRGLASVGGAIRATRTADEAAKGLRPKHTQLCTLQSAVLHSTSSESYQVKNGTCRFRSRWCVFLMKRHCTCSYLWAWSCLGQRLGKGADHSVELQKRSTHGLISAVIFRKGYVVGVF